MGGFVAWTFRSFVSEQNESAVHTWYEGQTPAVQAGFDTALKYLRDQPIWGRPYTGILEDGLIEIRFKVKNVQHRPLGFYGPLRREFTIVFFATERDDEFEPRNACSIALGRKTQAEGNREGRSREWSVE